MLTIFSLTAFTIFLVAILFLFYKKEKAAFSNYRRISDSLHNINDLNSLLTIMRSEIQTQGGHVFSYLQRNISNRSLESQTDTVSLFESNAVSKAFFTMTPQRLLPNNENDGRLISSYGNDLVAIPFHMKSKAPCWKVTNCPIETKCNCNRKHIIKCWIESGKNHRSVAQNSYREKLEKCLSCKAFLPFGVFICKTSKPVALTSFINDTFSGVLRGSVAYEKVVYSAMYDPLTNILNKRSLLHQVSAALKFAERHNIPVSLCMFDIDHFKKFNDSYGHQEGDRLLKELTSFISTLLRESDIFARYGGEEFSIILPGSGKKGAEEAMERVRSEVEKNIFCGDKHITISMGVSTFPDDNIDDVDVFLRKADASLYASKTTRNKVTTYKEGMKDNLEQKQTTKIKKSSTKKKSTESSPAQNDTPEYVEF